MFNLTCVSNLDPRVLTECKAYAEKGAADADNSLASLEVMIRKNISVLQKEVSSSNNKNDGKSNPILQDLKKEIQILEKFLDKGQKEIKSSIELRKKEMDKFSITLFGKTMAGKSTMMEVLIHGNGESIGIGKQRTTREVRPYEWNGLRIIDVPGIGGFETAEDENIAFEQAKRSDAIIFLLTDDAPGQEEAEFLCKLKELGKPILGLINVHVATNSSIKMLENKITKKYKSNDISDIVNQFYEFGEKYNKDWHNIHFIPVHLKCAFMAQQEKDKQLAAKYEELSRFSEVLEKIVEFIKIKGRILRYKTFVDISLNSMYLMNKEIINSRNKLHQNSSFIKNQCDAITKKKKIFIGSLNSDKAREANRLSTELQSKFSQFVNENYELTGDKVNKKINNLINQMDINGRLNTFVENNNKKLFNILRSFESDMQRNYNFNKGYINTSNKVNFEGGEINDYRKWINTGLAVFNLNPVLGVVFKSNPVGWGVSIAVTGVGFLVSWLVGSKEDRIKEQKEQLRDELKKIEDNIINTFQRELNRYSQNINNSLQAMIMGINKNVSSIDKIEDVNEKLINGLANSINMLNIMLVRCCIGDAVNHINSVERSMGEYFRIKTQKPEKIRGYELMLEEVLQERVLVGNS